MRISTVGRSAIISSAAASKLSVSSRSASTNRGGGASVAEEIYPIEFLQIKQNILNQITGIVSDDSLSESEKDAKIKGIVADNITEVNKIMEGKLKKSLSEISVKPNQEEGWGPNNGRHEEYILPTSAKNLIEDFNNSFAFDRTMLEEKMEYFIISINGEYPTNSGIC